MANSVIAKLGELGAHHLVDGRNPISFCNVLFTGNLIGGIVLFAIHRKVWTKENLSHLKCGDWGHMFLLAILAGIFAPTLFVIGLMLTEVINVVLISLIEIPLALLLAWAFFKEWPTWGIIIASLFAAVGIAAIFFLHDPEAMPKYEKMVMINIGDNPIAHFLASFPRAGEICIAFATFFTVLSVELSRKYLSEVPIGIYRVFRMLAGSVIFFFIVIIMLGWVHFIDVFNPFLLEWMLFLWWGNHCFWPFYLVSST